MKKKIIIFVILILVFLASVIIFLKPTPSETSTASVSQISQDETNLPTTTIDSKESNSNQDSTIESEQETSQDQAAESQNYGGIDTDINEHPLMNGANTKQIGTYATTNYDSSTTTDKNIIDFYNNQIKGKDYNYFILIDNTKSIKFIGNNGNNLERGTISKDGTSLVHPTAHGYINGNKIDWTNY